MKYYQGNSINLEIDTNYGLKFLTELDLSISLSNDFYQISWQPVNGANGYFINLLDSNTNTFFSTNLFGIISNLSISNMFTNYRYGIETVISNDSNITRRYLFQGTINNE